ncbi:FMN-binding protein [Zongyangia hominis]|uniref:Ion-translocating oxidoreductase complex subunit G n=1 Tax=Zongyangia hominis TaxID=2763677 RepID=A0A926ECB5_9FIRM|nr:FMN-binding protein [Zongyangia hominis]MBC8569336.1 FMN-binding protein [Zongyangia hominis]
MNIVREIIKPTAVLLIICLVVTACLVGTYQLTAPIIAAQGDAASNEARKEVLPDADGFEKLDVDEALAGTGILEIHKAKNGAGVTVKAVGKGYGGDITVMTGLDGEGAVVAVKVLEASETPGLGSKTAEPDFLNRFTGKSGNVDDVQTIAGATISSTAMKGILNATLAAYDQIKGEL